MANLQVDSMLGALGTSCQSTPLKGRILTLLHCAALPVRQQKEWKLNKIR